MILLRVIARNRVSLTVNTPLMILFGCPLRDQLPRGLTWLRRAPFEGLSVDGFGSLSFFQLSMKLEPVEVCFADMKDDSGAGGPKMVRYITLGTQASQYRDARLLAFLLVPSVQTFREWKCCIEQRISAKETLLLAVKMGIGVAELLTT